MDDRERALREKIEALRRPKNAACRMNDWEAIGYCRACDDILAALEEARAAIEGEPRFAKADYEPELLAIDALLPRKENDLRCVYSRVLEAFVAAGIVPPETGPHSHVMSAVDAQDWAKRERVLEAVPREGDEAIAKLFHETYERLAPSFDYKTRDESAVAWEQVPESNRKLMIVVCGHVRTVLAARAAAPLPTAREHAAFTMHCPKCGIDVFAHGETCPQPVSEGRLREALERIANSSPNWCEPQAVEKHSRECIAEAQRALESA